MLEPETGQSLEIVCPVCNTVTSSKEWRCVLRWVVAGSREGEPATVLKHQKCGTLVYLVRKTEG